MGRGEPGRLEMDWAEPALERRIAWLLTPMVTGAVAMSLELGAFRVYATFLGYSIYVWGGMIAGVMGATATGYAAGGRIADHHHTMTTPRSNR